MMRGIHSRAKCLFIAMLFCFQYGQLHAQTDVLTLSKIKDFINAALTRAILLSDSLKKDSSARYLPAIDSALQKNTLDNPVYYAAMQKLLEGKFDSVTKKFSSRVEQIDVRAYQQYNYEQAGKMIYDSAFAILRQQYAFFSPVVKDSLYTALVTPVTTVTQTPAVVADTTLKKVPQQVSKPSDYVPWYTRFSGFVFWLLACVLISVALFLYCLDQIRQLKAKLTDTEKQVVHLEEEKEHGVSHQGQGQVTMVYTEFRNLVTLKIKELYDIIDHLNQRLIHLETTHLPSPENETGIATESSIGQTFYMSAPLPGHFPFSARTLKKDSLYRFIVNGTDNEAHFEIINDGIPLTEALTDIPKYFEPACTLENELAGEVRVIITKTPGKARLDGEKWVIEQKASIIFI
jgi:hypothetical protein